MDRKAVTRLLALLVSAVLALAINLSNPRLTQAIDLTGYANDLQASQIVDLVNGDQDDFAGVAGDEHGSGLSVFVVGSRAQEASTLRVLSLVQQILGPTIESVAPRTSKLWNVHLATATHSLRELYTSLAQIPTKQPWAAIAAPYLATWMLDVRTNSVVVGLTSVSADLQVQASQSLGSIVRLVLTARPQLDNRFSDVSPFRGGDALDQGGDNPGGCTAGFAAHDSNNHPGLLTAGHCFNQNSAIYQGGNWVNNPNPTYPDGTKLGWVTIRVNGSTDPQASVTDGEFVDVTRDPCCSWQSQGRVFWGPATENWFNVSGALTSWVGANVCTDGAVTGTQNCAGNIGGGPGCVKFVNVVPTYCNLWLFHATDQPPSVMVRSGDSGGPVYQGDGAGGVRAMGQITGADSSNNNYWYADINEIARELNIALILNGQIF